ncbi:MAG: cadmium-translocating P-type ATPase, partial [Firmicutes bacterium]|nr:cadmium-translocating P-type ATPase [Bacillota bacterium]
LPYIMVAIYLIAAFPILKKAVRNIRHGEIFDENFLMTVASIGALILGEYVEGISVIVLYRIGEYLQDRAVARSRESISGLMDIRPDYANIEKDGELVRVDPSELSVGSVIVIKPGERIPADGEVIEGFSSLDTAAITGESLPRDVEPGSEVYSGTINLNAVLRVRVTAPASESTAARILDLVENATSRRAKAEKFITKFARYYTPAVCGAAALLMVLPPLLFRQPWSVWVSRGLIFLVVSCPCALIISIPLGFFAGIGAASSRGILVKGGNYLEALTKVDTLVFDKTGTLTKGIFKVASAHPADGMDKDGLIELACLAEAFSDHPISRSLEDSYGKPVDRSRVSEAEEHAGHGVSATVDGRRISCGNIKLMRSLGIDCEESSEPGTAVYVAADGQYLGCIVISDELKPDSAQAVKELKAAGLKKIVMLTGDKSVIAQKVASELSIDEVYGDLLPQDKVEKTRELKKELPEGRILGFVGDGINDAPVLAASGLGIAMGGMGSAAAVEAADIVLMNDRPSDVATAVKIAKKTMRIIYEDIAFSLFVKIGVLILAAFGFANMWLAIFADVGVCMIAILNSMRALRVN